MSVIRAILDFELFWALHHIAIVALTHKYEMN